MTIRKAGRNRIEYNRLDGGELTAIPIPTEARRGDLLVLTLLGGSGSVPVRCDDPRLARVDATDEGQPSGLEHVRDEHRPFGVWAGRMGDDWSSIQFHLYVLPGQWSQFSMATLEAYRDDSGAGVVMDGRRNWDYTLWPTDPEPPMFTPAGHLPGLPGEGEAALLFLSLWRNGIGGINGQVDFKPPRFSTVWDQSRTNPSGGYLDVFSFVSSRRVIDPIDYEGPSVDPIIGAIAADAVLMGVRPATPPVVRQYPRDDGLGLSSAPRLYATSRGAVGGRVVGAHP